ncbi:MAG: hypothetical protein ABJB93_11050 [Gaiellales bacterium]
MSVLPLTDAPVVERTEFLLRRLQGCPTAEHAAYLIARELPEAVGADWAAHLPTDATGGAGTVDPVHRQLAAAALATGGVFSMGEPPTVAAVPVRAGATYTGVLLIGRQAGLCRPQLQIAAVFAEHAGALLPTISIARAA